MVARGDLGVELPLEAVPIVQKRAIELARRMAKPVIVATQMLESMISSPVPTRAETSDVANAVLDGADAVMLSGETSVGEYPVITVQTMARIVASTEDHGLERIPPLGTKPRTQGGAITLAAAEVADFVDAKYVCVFTESGDSARRMSRLRFRIPMKAFTPDPAIRRRMALIWGIESFVVDRVTHTDAMYHQVDEVLLGAGPRRGRRQGRRDLRIPSRNLRLDQRPARAHRRRRDQRRRPGLGERRARRLARSAAVLTPA